MQAKNLSARAPRRWSDTLDGIRWLPRLIDKARSAAADTLGAYLYGQSPVDRGLLRALQMGHRSFAEIVVSGPDDASVLAALKARSSDDLAAARRWSDELPVRFRLLLPLLDVDDGYKTGASRLLKAPANACSWLISTSTKALWPSRAAQGLQARVRADANGDGP